MTLDYMTIEFYAHALQAMLEDGISKTRVRDILEAARRRARFKTNKVVGRYECKGSQRFRTSQPQWNGDEYVDRTIVVIDEPKAGVLWVVTVYTE